ncbi:protein PXR1-like [Penaeus chinensis]|uniref:protein PXR1-like n=1 Tax=Penaeus chinensis TaxID=139456 RepID=UPI001FB83111|nr:protein PXR1-like [Penaeus chinensis]
MKYSLLLLVALGLLCAASAKPHGDGKRTHVAKRTREHELSNRMGHGDHHRRDHSLGHKTDAHKNNSTHSAHRPAQHKLEGAHKAEARKALAHRNAGGSKGAKTPGGDAGSNHDAKDLQLQHITEHNIEKKHEDKQQKQGELKQKQHLVTNRVPSGHLITNRTPKVLPVLPSEQPKKGKKVKNGTKDGIPMESERLIHVTSRPPKVHKVNKNHHKSSQATAAVTPSPFSHSSSPAAKPKAHKPPKKYSPKKHGWKKSLRKEKGKDKSKDKAKEKRERREKRNKALHRAVVARKL